MPKREQVAPFVRKTFEMISDRNYAEIVSWADDGLSFIIWKPQKFRKKIIPLFFKHNNLCSFVRQLNTYGFHKVSRLKKEDYNVYNAQNHMQLNDDILEFQHQYFLKSRKDLLTEVVRKKKSKSKATAEAKEATPAKAQSQNNDVLLLDSPNSNSSATDNSPCTSPESFPMTSPRSPYHRKLSSDEINESNHNNCHSYLMQQMQLNEEKMRMKEESKKLYSTISYLTYQVQLLSSELKNSQEKIRELESDLFVATNRMSPFDQNNSNKNTNNNPNNNPHNNNNSFTMNKRRRLHDGVTSSLTYYSDLSLAQYYPDFQNSFFIQDQFAGLS